jgi:NAD(P)-dependent dehydrogenase (short-subunit alcohol dehydrogenase family)
VNNAGITMRGFFEDCDDAQIREIFETNVFGSMALTRAVLPHMRRAGRGRVAIITSIAGLFGAMAMSAYCASKFALEGFGEALAQEVAPLGLQVSMIEPGMIRTAVWDGNRRYGRRAQSEASPYYRWFCESERWVDQLLASSTTSPGDVASVVRDVLTTSRPPLRCVVGRRARWVCALRRCAPSNWFDRLYLREAVRRVSGNQRLRQRVA